MICQFWHSTLYDRGEQVTAGKGYIKGDDIATANKNKYTMLNSDYKFGEVHGIANQIETSEETVQFKHIFNNDNGGVVLVAFKEGQKLDTHTAPAEVMVNVLEGEIEFTMLDKVNTLRSGEFLLMGADVPHSVKAKSDSKMMLIKIRP